MTIRRNIAQALLGRAPHRSDDQGTMAMALLAIVVGMMLGAIMLPMIINQDRSTRFDVTRVHSLHAAQSGVDRVLGQIRASKSTDTDGNTFGNTATLPCWDQANPLNGNANGTGSGTYSVWIAYWANDPAAGGAPMLCSPGFGTYDPITKLPTPHYAVITSKGCDGPAPNGICAPPTNSASKGRTIVTTFVFQTDDTNIPGGLIRLYPDSSGRQFCMDAGSSTPSAGTSIVLQACSTSTPPAAQQVFAYRSDLSIQLVSSVTPTNKFGLCIDTSPTAHASSGVTMILNTCAVATPARCTDITKCSPSNQQWSVDDNAHLRGALGDKSNTDSYCIKAATQANGTPLVLADCAGGTSDSMQTWVPMPTAGAGMAGANNSQLVNYKQFATCLDVTGQDPNAAYLILYTCKQNPSPSKVLWNQKFAPSPALGAAPADVLLQSTTGGTTYCLTSPLTLGGYPRMRTPCPASAIAGDGNTWRVNQAQDSSGNDLSYAQKYTIVDAAGRCLSLGPNSDLYISQYLKATVSKCDGSTGQKWNANASLDSARLINTHESP